MNNIIKHFLDIHVRLTNEYFLVYDTDISSKSQHGYLKPNFTENIEEEHYSIIGKGYHYGNHKSNNKYMATVKNKEDKPCLHFVTHFGNDKIGNTCIYRIKEDNALMVDGMVMRNCQGLKVHKTNRVLPLGLIPKDEYFNLSLENEIPSYELYLLGIQNYSTFPGYVACKIYEPLLDLIKVLNYE
ncbi:hypothetical protein XaC1_125 [Xanthomonas phage XaC1]|nr:hypothetical protein XaC1_125 [Xanthomonas phage XaC1]